MSKSIYDLELHESIQINRVVQDEFGSVLNITRVPGGWMYNFSQLRTSIKDKHTMSESSVFVPYSEEFLDKATSIRT